MAPSPALLRSSLPSVFQALLLSPMSSSLPRSLVPRSAPLPGSAIVGIVLSAITFSIICIAAALYYRQRRHVSIESHRRPKTRSHSRLSFRCATRVTPTKSVFSEVAELKISNPIPFSAASSPPTKNDCLPLNPWNGQVAWPIKRVSQREASIEYPAISYPTQAHSRDHLLRDARPVPQIGTTAIMRRDQWSQRDQDKTSLWFQPRHLERRPNDTYV